MFRSSTTGHTCHANLVSLWRHWGPWASDQHSETVVMASLFGTTVCTFALTRVLEAEAKCWQQQTHTLATCTEMTPSIFFINHFTAVDPVNICIPDTSCKKNGHKNTSCNPAMISVWEIYVILSLFYRHFNSYTSIIGWWNLSFLAVLSPNKFKSPQY